MADIEVDFIETNIALEVQNPEVSLTLDVNSFHGNNATPISYTFQTLTPLATWNINHNLNYRPVVQVFNSASQLIFGNVIHMSDNQVIVSFTTPVSGFARLI